MIKILITDAEICRTPVKENSSGAERIRLPHVAQDL